jgi:hypothetical protein
MPVYYRRTGFDAWFVQKGSAGSDGNRASVVLAFGDVFIEQDGSRKNAEVNMLLSEGSVISTGPQSQCTVLIGGESYVQVKEESQMMIRDLTLAANGAEQTTLELRMGSSVLNPKKLLKDEEFRVATPTAIAAVRGTRFVVATDPSSALNVSVIEGSVSLKRRVEALEQADETVIRGNEILREIDSRLDEEVVLSANQSASIDNVNAAQLNRQVAEVLKKVSAAPAGEKAVIPDAAAVRQQLNTAMATVVIEKKEEVSEDDMRAVEELNIFIDKQERKRSEQSRLNAEQARQNAVLQIAAPVATADIFVNGRKLGTGNAVFSSETAGSVTVTIKAAGYLDYEQKVVIRNGETFVLRAELLEERKMTVFSGAVPWVRKYGGIS